ncbi:hypothetical protein LZ575_17460 [Antarcticibacterium sp. 1MA-6-2]|uniref:hypothetical protein n=1 Tax=Antarcticibacterium sp. 1MA-6-2 TaxID=2908210 RepID=UPI001F20843D|nr:hypothetical protein [Antarcticibacterium sp. 1MA-6-2]UJH90555.1 hypothetical protein LZ575_17460 [Antarcticibacterium sp. 1MA-6-2]
MDKLYEILDKHADFFNFFGKSGLFVELHAIIQAMQKSNDIQKFMRDGKKIIALA